MTRGQSTGKNGNVKYDYGASRRLGGTLGFGGNLGVFFIFWPYFFFSKFALSLSFFLLVIVYPHKMITCCEKIKVN